MLLYNRAFDPNHTLFRMLAIIYFYEAKEIESDRLRIYDFIVAFPVHISDMRLTKDLVGLKRYFKGKKSAYSNFDPEYLFSSMASIQAPVIAALFSLGVLEKYDTHGEKYVINKAMMPAVIHELVCSPDCSLDGESLDFISRSLPSIPLIGPDGLKARSKLMGYRYDAA